MDRGSLSFWWNFHHVYSGAYNYCVYFIYYSWHSLHHVGRVSTEWQACCVGKSPLLFRQEEWIYYSHTKLCVSASAGIFSLIYNRNIQTCCSWLNDICLTLRQYETKWKFGMVEPNARKWIQILLFMFLMYAVSVIGL